MTVLEGPTVLQTVTTPRVNKGVAPVGVDVLGVLPVHPLHVNHDAGPSFGVVVGRVRDHLSGGTDGDPPHDGTSTSFTRDSQTTVRTSVFWSSKM